MKSNDWRHKNVARYTPGNTKILYFFNCLLDGMHTIIVHICDFRRGVLNTRSVARIQHLLPGHKYGLLDSLRAVFGWRGKIQNLYESKQKPLPKSSNPLKGLNNLFISYEKQNTKEAYNSNGNLERV